MSKLEEGWSKLDVLSNKRRVVITTVAVVTISLLVITTNMKFAQLIPNLNRAKPISRKFEEEIVKLGAIPIKVTTGGALNREPCVLVAATSPNYTWSRGWAERRRSEGVPFVLLELMRIRNEELAGYWSKVPGLIATLHVLQNAKIIVYSDVDTNLGWPFVCERAMRSPSAMTISYKMWPPKDRKVHMRTNWFTINTSHPESKHLLYTWYYKGRNVPVQDQNILNQLYHNKSWIRDSIELFPLGNRALRKIELKQCGSWLKPASVRAKCMGIEL